MTQDMRTDHAQQSTNGVQLSPRSLKNGSSVNGHSSPNGVSEGYTNGIRGGAGDDKPTEFYGHDREEVTRLLIQGLGDLGYEQSAQRLSQESGYEVESSAVAAFRASILNGDWSNAEAVLFKKDTRRSSPPDGGGVSIRNGTAPHRSYKFAFVEGTDKDDLRFLIREQKYLELLEKGDTTGAMMVLQAELQPLRPAIWDKTRLNALAE